jgi:Fur family ferric uptake transcriptional regulator
MHRATDHATQDRWLARAAEALSGPGRNHGRARTAVIQLLSSDAQCLLNTQQIIERLALRQVSSQASVYRVLQELLQLGLLARWDGQDGVTRYEILDPDHPHHHFIDQHTGDISPFQDEQLDAAIRRAAQRHGIELARQEVTLHGSRMVP